MPQFWAQIIELDTEQAPTCISTVTAEDAAYTQINQFLEMTQGEITTGALRVWAFGEDASTCRAFDWQVEISMAPDQPDDLEEGEVEMEAEVTLEERMD